MYPQCPPRCVTVTSSEPGRATRLKVAHEDHRVVRRRDEVRRRIERLEDALRDRIAAQVMREVRVVRVLQHHALRHRGERRVVDQLAEVVVVRPGRLLEPQRPPPLEEKIAPVDRGPALERIERRRRVQHRTDGDDARNPDPGRTRLRADAQAEVAAEREAGEQQAMIRVKRLQRGRPRRRLPAGGRNGTARGSARACRRGRES